MPANGRGRLSGVTIERSFITAFARSIRRFPVNAQSSRPHAPVGDLSINRRISLLTYSPGLLLVVIVIADVVRYADPDLWGHLAFAQLFLRSGHIVARDPFSYSAPGHPWHDPEWLSEILMALSYDAWGVLGLKLMKFACTGTIFVLLALAIAETGAGATVQCGVLIATALGIGLELQIRPQLFTFLSMAALFAILARDNYRRRAPLWLAIPVLTIWVNTHGGFLIGLMMLAVYTGISTLQDVLAGRGWSHGLKLAAITVAATLATLINPYGLGEWTTVGTSVLNPVTRNAIEEWRPLLTIMIATWQWSHVGVIYYLLVLGIIALFVVTIAIKPLAGDLPLVAIAAITCAAAFVSVRHVPLAVISMSLPITRRLGLWFNRARETRASGVRGAPGLAKRYNQGFLFVVAFLLALETGLFSSRLPETTAYPQGALAFMRLHALHGNLLDDFNWGDYLIFHTAPQSKVFIDGRFDFIYPNSVVDDFFAFYFNGPGAAHVLESYPHDFVLIPPTCRAYALMTSRKDWTLLYRDQVAALFARADSPAARLPNIPVVAVATPHDFP
jgi:hypothetical protein